KTGRLCQPSSSREAQGTTCAMASTARGLVQMRPEYLAGCSRATRSARSLTHSYLRTGIERGANPASMNVSSYGSATSASRSNHTMGRSAPICDLVELKPSFRESPPKWLRHLCEVILRPGPPQFVPDYRRDLRGAPVFSAGHRTIRRIPRELSSRPPFGLMRPQAPSSRPPAVATSRVPPPLRGPPSHREVRP